MAPSPASHHVCLTRLRRRQWRQAHSTMLPSPSARTRNASAKAALSNGEFLRQSCASMKIAIGPRNHAGLPPWRHRERYAPDDSAALATAISASYRQVFGNAHVMDNERSAELEARLRQWRAHHPRFRSRPGQNLLLQSPLFRRCCPSARHRTEPQAPAGSSSRGSGRDVGAHFTAGERWPRGRDRFHRRWR